MSQTDRHNFFTQPAKGPRRQMSKNRSLVLFGRGIQRTEHYGIHITFIFFLFLNKSSTVLKGAASSADLLLAPVEGFDQGFFVPFRQQKAFFFLQFLVVNVVVLILPLKFQLTLCNTHRTLNT